MHPLATREKPGGIFLMQCTVPFFVMECAVSGLKEESVYWRDFDVPKYDDESKNRTIFFDVDSI